MNASLRRIVHSYALTTTSLSGATIETWIRRLTKASQGLDLSYANDRFDFRRKVADLTRNSRVELIAELARHFGREPQDDSRENVVAALARAWSDSQS